MAKTWPRVQKPRGAVRGRLRQGAMITILRARLRRGRLRRAWSALFCLALAGCAGAAHPPAQATGPGIAAVGGPDEGTVAVVRPVEQAGAAVTPRADMLTAMGVSPAAMPSSSSLAEIIVRTDGGETLSVVQSDSARFTPGERVMIIPGGTARLLPLASVSPAS